jgi:hypothetical protein
MATAVVASTYLLFAGDIIIYRLKETMSMPIFLILLMKVFLI